MLFLKRSLGWSLASLGFSVLALGALFFNFSVERIFVISFITIGLMIQTINIFFMFKNLELMKQDDDQIQSENTNFSHSQTKIRDQLVEAREDGFRYKTLLRSLSHDLSTSMTLIYGISSPDYIKKSDELPELHKILDSIHKSVHMQIQLIKHIRHMESLITDKKYLKLKNVEISESIEKLKGLVSQKLKEKSLSLNITSSVESPLWIYAEEISFVQIVLLNILNNAIKFSYPNQTIELRIKSVSNEWVVVEVVDHGNGIPRYLVEKISQRSKLPSSKGTDGEDGSGFGLVIVHTYMELYGGRVQIQSLNEKNSGDGDSAVSHGTKVELYLKKSA